MLNWQQLVRESDEQLATRDIAEVHLACAAGLPSAGEIDVDRCRQRLDYYARRVQSFTETHMKQFRRKRWDYNNSEGYFRILAMITVLQRDLGVRYNPAKIDDEVPLETADRFIHGALFGEGGSCGSLAFLYIAVGRRLGYPLKLVQARRGPYGHLFPRWDDGQGERFNVEATNRGLGCYPDDYYRTGRFQIDAEKERRLCLLQSLTPRQELAVFLGERGNAWLQLGDYRQAIESFAWARAADPRNDGFIGSILGQMNRWRDVLNAKKPPIFPEIYVGRGKRRFSDAVPVDLELGIIELETIENILACPVCQKQWWGPLRRGQRPAIPTTAFVDYLPDGWYNIRYEYARSTPLSFSITAGV